MCFGFLAQARARARATPGSGPGPRLGRALFQRVLGNCSTNPVLEEKKRIALTGLLETIKEEELLYQAS